MTTDLAQRLTEPSRRLLLVVATVAATLLASMAWPTAALAAVGAPTTYLDHTYGSTQPPSADKPQSKLWFHGESWWALMVPTGGTQVTIHELMANHTWRNTGVVVDTRTNSTGDALWSERDNRLYVASRTSGSNLQVVGFTFDSTNRTWARSFRTSVNSGGGSESATIDQDSLGRLWVTYTRGSRVWVAHSTNEIRSIWTAGFLPTVGDTTIAPDDISGLIAFGTSIGVLYSDQESGGFHFAIHDDGPRENPVPDNVWRVEDVSFTDIPLLADDHINLKQLGSDGTGRVFAAIKTSAGDDPAADPNAAQVGVLTRTPGVNGGEGSWSFTPAGTVAERWTRPIIMIDDTNDDLYFLATSDEATIGEDIVYRKSDLPPDPSQGLSFGPTQTFLDAAPTVNNATGAKEPVTAATGLVILASAPTPKQYAHAEMALAPGGRFDAPTGGDTTRPTLTARAPAANATGVGVAANVTATFSEAVKNVSTTTFMLTDIATGVGVPAAVTQNGTTNQWILNPTNNLTPDTRYRATLTTGIQDTAGNALTANDSWEFLTGPAPRISGRTPAVNATGVSRTANITVTFSEAVQGVSASTFTLRAGTTAVSATVSQNGTTNQWILNPASTLAANTKYTATVTGGASGIRDMIGNPLSTTSWSLTTGA